MLHLRINPAPVKEQGSEDAFTEHSTEFPECEEGNQRHRNNQSPGYDFGRTSTADFWDALRNRFSFPNTGDDILRDVEADEDDREQK
jgi:hypothetical protein